jgi:hypothetical protein
MDFKTKLAKLIDVKTLVTFTVIGVFAYLALTDRITPENVMQVVLVIIAFFFAKKESTGGEA